MEFDFSFLLWLLPLTFGLGWVASRFDLRQLRIENRNAPKAYFKGLNYLLNEQQDQAIDAFIEAAQKDPDTSELHFALGNLFRRRGDYERAVRVHQHLLAREDLKQDDLLRAQQALALDFLKAGLLDRAENAFLKLKSTRFENDAQLALLAIYERTRDWPKAGAMAHSLQVHHQGRFHNRQAHYLCEQAQSQLLNNDPEKAAALLEKAIMAAPALARPRIMLANSLQAQNQPEKAFEILLQAYRDCPSSAPLMALQLAQWARSLGRTQEVIPLLESSYEQTHALDVIDALNECANASDNPLAETQQRLLTHLKNSSSLITASRWMLSTHAQNFPDEVKRALEHSVKPLLRYRCAACGFEAKQHFWQCPGCQAWDSYPARRVEEL